MRKCYQTVLSCASSIRACTGVHDFINNLWSLKPSPDRTGPFQRHVMITATEWTEMPPHKRVEALYQACTSSAEALDALITIHEVGFATSILRCWPLV
jgi:hypothetical protein